MRNKLSFIKISILALAMIILPFSARANLISNPGFEEGEVGWKSFKPAGAAAAMTIFHSQDCAHSGSHAAGIWPMWMHPVSGYYGYYQRIMSPTPNQPWKISGWMENNPLHWEGPLEGWIQAEFYDNTQGGLDHRIWEADIATPRLSQPTGIYDYEYFESPIGYVPSNAKMAQVVFLVYNPSDNPSGASFEFDDLDLEAVPEPTTLILFGIGLIGLFLAGRINKSKELVATQDI